MSINNRIKQIRESIYNDSTKDFASDLKVSSQAISNYVREGYNVGREVIENILNLIPTLDANWLIMGKGDMLINDKSSSFETNIDFKEKYYELLEENIQLLRENSRIKEDNAYFRGLLQANAIDHKQTAS